MECVRRLKMNGNIVSLKQSQLFPIYQVFESPKTCCGCELFSVCSDETVLVAWLATEK